MKNILEGLIRRRNPLFRFDPAADSRMLFCFCSVQLPALLRGCVVLFRLRRSKGLLLGRGVSFFLLSRIHWGRWVRIGEFSRLSGLGAQGISIGNNVSIGAWCRLIVSTSPERIGSHIRIGNNVGIGEFSYLGGGGGLDIGDGTIIGQYLSCHPEEHIFIHPDRPIRRQGVTRKGIHIGRDCWLGAKVTVLDGVCIGDGCVIAAGAVVTRSIPAGSIAAGIPARVIRYRGEAPIKSYL